MKNYSSFCMTLCYRKLNNAELANCLYRFLYIDTKKDYSLRGYDTMRSSTGLLSASARLHHTSGIRNLPVCLACDAM
jgi:hypothetical protein